MKLICECSKPCHKHGYFGEWLVLHELLPAHRQDIYLIRLHTCKDSTKWLEPIASTEHLVLYRWK